MKFQLFFIFIILACTGCEPNGDKVDSQWEQTISENSNYAYSKFITESPKSTYFNEAVQNWTRTYEPVMADCFGDCISFDVDDNNQFLYQGYFGTLDSVKQIAKTLIQKGKPPYPRKLRQVVDKNGITREISRARFEFTYSKNSIQFLQNIVAEVCAALDEYKNQLSIEWYNKEFEKINYVKQSHLDSLLATRLIFFKYEIVGKRTLHQAVSKIDIIKDEVELVEDEITTPVSKTEDYYSCTIGTYMIYDSLVNIYDIPNGKIIGTFCFEEEPGYEEGRLVTLDMSTEGWFRISHLSSNLDWEIYKNRWIQSEMIEIGTNNYSDSEIPLLENPNVGSTVIGVINEESYLKPIKASGTWVYVKKDSDNEGWLEDKYQCNNPYTNCN